MIRHLFALFCCFVVSVSAIAGHAQAALQTAETGEMVNKADDATARAPHRTSPFEVVPTRPELFRNDPEITINFDPRSMAR